ncbi:MAG TPA: hypothetical protein H9923_01490 [Candidatus Dwaynia gallinarum]|nr:hypothetical protein [Candidatus Dwaynia gallinarum]
MAKRNIPNKYVKELYAKSGNKCAFRGCNQILFDGINLSEICHIRGLNKGSARFDPNLTDEMCNNIKNLILLCPTHHAMVDNDENKYSVEVLEEMKYEREKEVESNNNNVQEKKFFYELKRIFQKYRLKEKFVDRQFVFVCLEDFEDMYSAIAGINELLESEYAFNISNDIKLELEKFNELIDLISQNLAIKSHANDQGKAIPKFEDDNVRKEFESIMMQIREIYFKYGYM